MILVPKARPCSKLHDGYQNSLQLFVLLSVRKEKRSVLELRVNPVYEKCGSFHLHPDRPFHSLRALSSGDWQN